MTSGPSGFLQARFGLEDVIQTEIPNLLLGLPAESVLKRPAGRRKPAAQPKKKSRRAVESASDSLGEEEQEEDLEEEGEEPGEEEEVIFEDEVAAEAEEQETPAEDEPEDVEEEEAEVKLAAAKVPAQGSADARKYRLEVYKKAEAFGVRQCFDNKAQIFSIGGKSFPLAKKRKWAEEALRRLHRGDTEEEVKAWAFAQLGK